MGHTKLPIRGGNWNNGSNAGVFNLNLNNPRSNVNTNIGFRSALPSIWPEVSILRDTIQRMRTKGSISLPGNRKNIKLP